MNTALLTRTDELATVTRIDEHATDAVYVAPTRFDVHTVADFRRWAASSRWLGATELVVDCHAVEFVDRAALAAITRFDHAEAPVTIVDASLAMGITLELLAVSTTPGADLDAVAVAA